jgi:hypothetical protein
MTEQSTELQETSVKESLSLTGAPGIAGHLYDYVGVLQNKVFIGSTQQNVMQFALAVGLKSNNRLPKKDWNAGSDGKTKTYPGSQFSTYNGAKGIAVLLESLSELGKDSVTSNVEEFINGGLTLLKNIKFEELSIDSWESFYAEFPHIDPEPEESDEEE